MAPKKSVIVGGQEYVVVVGSDGQVLVNGAPRRVDLKPVGDAGAYSVIVDDECYDVFVRQVDGDYFVELAGTSYRVAVRDAGTPAGQEPAGSAAPGDGPAQLDAPMPGIVVSVFAVVGQRVVRGDVLVVLESMKMMNELRSPADGVVVSVSVTPGERVERRQALVCVEREPSLGEGLSAPQPE